MADWSSDAVWIVWEALLADVVQITADGGGKVKAPRGNVIYAGDRATATQAIAARRKGHIVGAVDNGGNGSTLTGGNGSTLTLRWYDGNRFRVATFYVGEHGIEPGIAYACVNGKAVRK